MKLKIDKNTDAIYPRIAEDAVVESDEVAPGVTRDFDADNTLVGVEILNFSALSAVPGSVPQSWLT